MEKIKIEVLKFTTNDGSWVIFDDLSAAFEWIKSDWHDLDLSDPYTYSFEKIKMTQEEIDNLPEFDG